MTEKESRVNRDTNKLTAIRDGDLPFEVLLFPILTKTSGHLRGSSRGTDLYHSRLIYKQFFHLLYKLRRLFLREEWYRKLLVQL